MEESMHERLAPGSSDHLGAEHDVAELARKAVGQVTALVDRKREDIGCLVDTEMLAFEQADFVRTHKGEAEIPLGNSLGSQHPARQGSGLVLVNRQAAAVLELDPDHLRR